MIEQLMNDSRAFPGLFRWKGPPDHAALEEWVSQFGALPSELVDLWVSTGGGDVFESETLLAPLSRDEDDLDSVNARLREQGMDDSFLAVHVGSWTTALDLQGVGFVEIDWAGRATPRRFDGLADWYAALRAEFGERYGLL